MLPPSLFLSFTPTVHKLTDPLRLCGSEALVPVRGDDRGGSQKATRKGQEGTDADKGMMQKLLDEQKF